MHHFSVLFVLSFPLFFAVFVSSAAEQTANLQKQQQLFTIEGKTVVNAELQRIKPNWKAGARIFLDYGKFVGFIRRDGSFIVPDVPSGSYILDVASGDFQFESVRVDITNSGKIRARRLNLVQPNVVSTLPYPVKLTARHPMRYFRVREEWRITDVLMNPMMLMMGAAFILVVLMPKLAAQDPNVQKEMQNMQLPKVDMPDMADMLANIWSSGSNKKGSRKQISSGQNTKRVTR
ncbi:hypothetical protein niasHS_010281 [Heterodera schachtii]|uniref:ER membrane protein complex subunit 7 beta-sandwich domain-containing protein n=1 Tax=Heterodera schachtii TaxID=97005 RepID=A0ABD2J1G6_HETSC